MTASPAHSLFRAELYEAELERLRRKARERRGRGELSSAGVPISCLGPDGRKLCQLVAREIQAGAYRLGPLVLTRAIIDGKRRTLYRAELVDALVLGALGQRLTELNESRLGDEVFSYRRGRSPWQAIERVQAYLEGHRQSHADPRSRGLWVLQRDIQEFGASIPTDEGSALWSLVAGLLGTLPEPAEARVAMDLCRQACRPEVVMPDGGTTRLERGLPTGAPTQQPLENLYLTSLDDALTAIAGGLYVRFGDDLLFMSPDRDQARQAAEVMAAVTGALGLSLKLSKQRDLYFTQPGRPPPVVGDGFDARPTPAIEYLGARIDFCGRLGLKRQRVRELRQRWQRRLKNLVACAEDQEPLELVARGLSEALRLRAVGADPAVQALRDWVDDRAQLHSIDYLLVLDCAEAVSGRRGVRAFRQVSRHMLRMSGLPSLEYQRRRSRTPE